MSSISEFILPITAAFAVAGTLLVVATTRRRRQRDLGHPPSSARTLEMQCTVCQRGLVIHPSETIELIPAEMALVVSTKPKARGRKLAQYRCPYCDASHCFGLDATPIEWIVTNAYEAQSTASHCTNCRRPLKNPPWPREMYDGRLDQVPILLPEHGLICSRCEAVCCLECCQKITRNRTQDGSLLCPRCSRGPVDKVFHF